MLFVVPGLRDTSAQGKKKDYSNTLRTTTMRTFLEHANSEKGLVLNCLKLPQSHAFTANPLAETGLDLEDLAYRQTDHFFAIQDQVPSDMRNWEIAATPDALTIPHFDKAPTRFSVNGYGGKLWITKRPVVTFEPCGAYRFDVENTFAFDGWDPDLPDTENGRYEGVLLLPRGGTLYVKFRN